MDAMLQQKLIAYGCVVLGAYLLWIAVRSFGSGVNRGRSRSSVYTREDQPGWFHFYCWARLFIGTLALVGGVVYSSRLPG